MASLSYLQPHINAIHAKAEALDVPTPVIDALQELFRRGYLHPIIPVDILMVYQS